jgi:hypothetical protein
MSLGLIQGQKVQGRNIHCSHVVLWAFLCILGIVVCCICPVQAIVDPSVIIHLMIQYICILLTKLGKFLHRMYSIIFVVNEENCKEWDAKSDLRRFFLLTVQENFKA